MNHDVDYRQPDFFRFGWDQLFFVDKIREFSNFKSIDSLVELGAGSGIITCELARKIPINRAHLVEYQQKEWEDFLTSNMQTHSAGVEANYHWCKVSEFNLDQSIKTNLIVCNPPYYLPRAGRASLDPRRNIAHRFVVDDWQAWVDAMVRTLAPGGEAWWLHRDPGPQGKPRFPEHFEWKHVVRLGRMRIIRLSNLQIE